MPSLAEVVLLSLIVAVAGLLRGFSGFGFSMFAVPLMATVMAPARAVPVILALTFVSNLQTLRADWDDIDRRSVLSLVAWAIPFAMLGNWVLSVLDERPLRIIIGLVTVGATLVIWRAGPRERPRPSATATAFTGMTSGVLHGLLAMGGPPLTMYYLRGAFSPQAARASMLATFTLMTIGPLAEAILAGGAWADWGVQEPVGPVEVVPPDPTQSGLGALYVAHLVGASQETLADVLPAVRGLLGNLGYLYPSSETLFGLYAEQGPGALPLIVGQERQMLAFLAAHPGEEAAIRGHLRVLYPRPTVWVRHPLLVLDERAVPLLAALGDDDVRRLAWARYGYRAGAGAAEDPAALEAAGLPVTIEATAPPDAETMNRIILGLEQ